MLVKGPQGTLYVEDAGRRDAAAPPMVFVHGWAGNAGQWDAQLAHFGRTRRTIALDVRGHGRSAPPADGDYSIPAMAADVGAALDALDVARAVLVGHSQGAMVVLEFAGAWPARVAGVALVDPGSDPAAIPAALWPQLEAYAASLAAAPHAVAAGYLDALAGPCDATRARIRRDLHDTPAETLVSAGVRAWRAWDPKPALERYPGPILLLNTPESDQPGALHRLGRAMRHETIGRAGHWLHLDRPDAVHRALDAFLAALA